MDWDVRCIVHIQWIIRRSVTGLQQLLILLCMHRCTYSYTHMVRTPIRSSSQRCNHIQGILRQCRSSWEGYNSQQRKSPCNLVPECSGENPWMFYTLANEHSSHTAVNVVWSRFFFPTSCCCCCVWCGSDVFIRLSERKCLQLWRIPPEPVTLLVSMAVLQAAPQAACVQGPIQPVFSAAARLMFSPGAGVKLPSAERENTAALRRFTRRCIATTTTKKRPHLNKPLFSAPP